MVTLKEKSEITLLQRFEKTIERWSNQNIEEIRQEPLDKKRGEIEKKKGQINLISEFPFIGRGNVQRENIISHEDIEKELDDILR